MNFKECARLLSERDNILLVTHKNPDGDTMGSAAALCSALRRKGKTAWLYPNDAVIEKLLPYVKAYFAPADFSPAYIVSVDVATEKMFARGFDAAVNLCIDHHPTNSHYAPKELIRADRSSCGEIVLELIKALCGGVERNEATLLYIAVSKLDVLSYLDEIPICARYELNGEEIDYFPFPVVLPDAKPVMTTMPGWKCDISGVRKWEDLPEAARNYVEYVEQQIGCRITYVSVGPERDSIIIR